MKRPRRFGHRGRSAPRLDVRSADARYAGRARRGGRDAQGFGNSNLNEGLIWRISLTTRSMFSSVSSFGCFFQAL